MINIYKKMDSHSNAATKKAEYFVADKQRNAKGLVREMSVMLTRTVRVRMIYVARPIRTHV